jgi:hypothetical protein
MITNPADAILLARLQLLAQTQQYEALNRITTKWLENNTAGIGSAPVLPSRSQPEQTDFPDHDTSPTGFCTPTELYPDNSVQPSVGCSYLSEDRPRRQ